MKTYQCPFCTKKLIRQKLVDHINKEHEDELPEDMTAYHLVYDIIYGYNDHHGRCCVCHGPTQWSEKTQKYFRICSDECKKKLREQYKKNMLRVYGKVHLLDDPEHQEKMLANRRISGTYTWRDSTKTTYTGSYEKKFLEFLDDVMSYDSRDILMPGPILEYEYKGKKLHWITDCLILSLNLIVEIKDGSSNKNGRPMQTYREKQVYKEKMITNMGTYSYLRLTNNEFGQLLSILAELKMQLVDTGSKDPIFRIHEEVEENYLESIGEMAINKLKQTYLPVHITTTGKMIDESSYEVCTVKPINVSKGGRLLFSKSVYEAMEIIHDIYPGISVECEYIDTDNITEGMNIIIVDNAPSRDI